MVTDHTKSSSLLKAIALDHGVVLPENPGPQADVNCKRLEELSGATFDKTYNEIMVTDHEDMLDAFEVEAVEVAKAADSKLKDLIATVHPVVACTTWKWLKRSDKTKRRQVRILEDPWVYGLRALPHFSCFVRLD
jgi:predicted outer membrane protein